MQILKQSLRKILWHAVLLGTVFSLCLSGQSARILMEGEFDDWSALTPAYVDASGDQLSGNLDFRRLWIANDENYLFIRIEVSEEITFQENNTVAIYIDTDFNAQTGTLLYGVGAELWWNFGLRDGQFVSSSGTNLISQAQIGIVTAPTVTSTQFEIAIRRDATPVGSSALFPLDQIRIVFEDRGAGADVLPNEAGGVGYQFDNTVLPPLQQSPISQKDPQSLRFLSYNVQRDALFDPLRQPHFRRILQAVQPQIIGFQEIYNHSAAESATLVENILPSGAQEQWFSAEVGSDVLVVSRFPVLASYPIEGFFSPNGNGAFLIDLNPAYNSELLLIVAHPPCCAQNMERQYEVDAIMAFVRDAKAPGGVLTLDPETPILIVGDMNLVGDAQQLTTLLTGEIINTANFGNAFMPDWDNTDFADLVAPNLNSPMFYTWYDEFSSYSPGRLDFMIYSDAVLQPLNRYSLFTPALSSDTLTAYGLFVDDATAASDHLPLVADFVLTDPTAIVTSGDENLPEAIRLFQNYPNPFNPRTTIEFELPAASVVTLEIFDIIGRHVKTLHAASLPIGHHKFMWNATDAAGRPVASGVYYYRLRAGDFVQTRKMLLVR